jgi:phenylacetate-coenzyme A ligase PaaK-like adenylate-forming protein
LHKSHTYGEEPPHWVSGNTQDAVKNTIGVTVTTSVETPGTTERSTGKMRRIVDHRPR